MKFVTTKVFTIFNLISLNREDLEVIESEWSHKEEIKERYASMPLEDFEAMQYEEYVSVEEFHTVTICNSFESADEYTKEENE